ncbi:TPA: phosphoadenosine phosphosulfate reductase family protein [Clostridioides difficile]|nr:phosphoadenosine phosphosulfate reductase family protein [Clostridioides difficile]HBF4443357.1 phosphoadenosine phosphosulfate reductase family protein [Clostridioides difficile]HBH4055529.1 phosphoadenosine phosphosulfate reductase family protein [Clostridioides difficile]
MKPIFNEEKKFLELKLGITLPNDCWRHGSKIYLNHFDKCPIITFKVDGLHDKIKIKKNSLNNVDCKNYTLEQEYNLIKKELNEKYLQSIQMTKTWILKYKNSHKLFVSISGGKDSDITRYIVDKSIREIGEDIQYNLIAFNTSNDTAETYKYLKQEHNMSKDNIISPKLGYYQWITKKKKYFTPTVMNRNCCSTYKEGQMTKIMDKKDNILIFLGMRAEESSKRSHYDWNLNEAQIDKGKKLNVPKNWIRFLPIVKWSDAEIWLFILHNNFNYNKMYDLGFNRVGCLICPFQSDYIDLLIREYYPTQWKRWRDILTKNYELFGIERRLKWSLLEWTYGGKWKQGTSKEQELINKKATSERVSQLANLKNISEETALKYFNKECKCHKKLNPSEIAMNLKIFGTYENKNDNRVYLCKKCLCKELNISNKDYVEKVKEFTYGGCNLF